MSASKAVLSNFLTAPSKIASALDWRKTSGAVLSLTVRPNEIRLALAHHPDNEWCSTEEEEERFVIPFGSSKKAKIQRDSLQYIQDIADKHGVCGFVVHWPVERDEPLRVGSKAGRVLHVLDQLMEAHVVSKRRPFCLWDATHAEEHQEQKQDAFGRCAVYGHSPSPQQAADIGVYSARLAQNDQNDNQVMVDVWNDYCQTHWPQLYQHSTSSSSSSSSSASESTPNYADLLQEGEEVVRTWA